jgi:hypothetical protein
MIWPVQDIDIGQSFNKDLYQKAPLSYGDHKLKLKDPTSVEDDQVLDAYK